MRYRLYAFHDNIGTSFNHRLDAPGIQPDVWRITVEQGRPSFGPEAAGDWRCPYGSHHTSRIGRPKRCHRSLCLPESLYGSHSDDMPRDAYGLAATIVFGSPMGGACCVSLSAAACDSVFHVHGCRALRAMDVSRCATGYVLRGSYHKKVSNDIPGTLSKPSESYGS